MFVEMAPRVNVHRGALDEAQRIVRKFAEGDVRGRAERAGYDCGKSAVLLARGDAAEALRVARRALEARTAMGFSQEYMKEAFVTAVESRSCSVTSAPSRSS